MPKATGRVNRGPAAAAANREAILTAARRIFARHGFAVPLSAIAREAGVSQGVMYRHFTDRFEVAIAVFEQNFAALEVAAAGGDPGAFGRLWRTVLQQTVEVSAFVEMVVESRRSKPSYDGGARVYSLFATTLPLAQANGTAAEHLTVADVMRAWRMAFGIVITADPPGSAWDDLAAAGLLQWASDSPSHGPLDAWSDHPDGAAVHRPPPDLPG